MKALLHDMTRCIGCRGCQVACKQWNDNPAGETSFFSGPGYQNPAGLDYKTYTLITYNEIGHEDHFCWVFGKLQCKHCLEPACEAVCPAECITKTGDGPVVVDREKCMGCKMCETVCAFDTPKYNEDGDGKMHKCWFCGDRVQAGDLTACAKACAPKAMIIGDRDDILKEAKQRIAASPDRYINKIYGLEEAGGTCVFYLSRFPFTALGFPDAPKHVIKVARATIVPNLDGINPAAIAASVCVAGVGWIIKRRDEMAKL